MSDYNKSIGPNLKKLISEKGITAKDLAAKVGVSPTHISYVLNNKRKPSFELLDSIADVLGVKLIDIVKESSSEYSTRTQQTVTIPVLGNIPAGAPIEAVEDIIGWEEIPKDWLNGDREYFSLLVRGDSMYPEYIDGDVVIVRRQSTCDSGDDCVVMVNDKDATLKKVNIYPDGLELKAINKMYGKRKFTKQEILSLPVTILGVVVELRRKKK